MHVSCNVFCLRDFQTFTKTKGKKKEWEGRVEITGRNWFFSNAFCQSFIIYLNTKSRHVLCWIDHRCIRTWTPFLHNVNHITSLMVPKIFWTLTLFHWVWNLYKRVCKLYVFFAHKCEHCILVFNVICSKCQVLAFFFYYVMFITTIKSILRIR